MSPTGGRHSRLAQTPPTGGGRRSTGVFASRSVVELDARSRRLRLFTPTSSRQSTADSRRDGMNSPAPRVTPSKAQTLPPPSQAEPPRGRRKATARLGSAPRALPRHLDRGRRTWSRGTRTFSRALGRPVERPGADSPGFTPSPFPSGARSCARSAAGRSRPAGPPARQERFGVVARKDRPELRQDKQLRGRRRGHRSTPQLRENPRSATISPAPLQPGGFSRRRVETRARLPHRSTKSAASTLHDRNAGGDRPCGPS